MIKVNFAEHFIKSFFKKTYHGKEFKKNPGQNG